MSEEPTEPPIISSSKPKFSRFSVVLFSLVGAVLGAIIGIPGCVLVSDIDGIQGNLGFRDETTIGGVTFWNGLLLLFACMAMFGSIGAVIGGCIGYKITRSKDK